MKRNYSNTAVVTALTNSVDSTASTLLVDSADGYPDAPFTIILDPDTVTEEICLVTAKATTTFTVTRGFDGTSAHPHSAGGVVKHGAVALDFREANAVSGGVIDGASSNKTWKWLAEK